MVRLRGGEETNQGQAGGELGEQPTGILARPEKNAGRDACGPNGQAAEPAKEQHEAITSDGQQPALPENASARELQAAEVTQQFRAKHSQCGARQLPLAAGMEDRDVKDNVGQDPETGACVPGAVGETTMVEEHFTISAFSLKTVEEDVQPSVISLLVRTFARCMVGLVVGIVVAELSSR
jgi:hypothetical protein